MPAKGYRKPANLREVRVNLSALNLPGPEVGEFVVPLVLADKDRAALRRWLSDAQIDRLASSLEAARDTRRWRREQPTLGEEKKTLEALATLADALAYILENASDGIRTTIDGISWRARRNLTLRGLEHECRTLHAGCAQALAEADSQGRPSADLFAVDVMASCIVPAGIKVSASSGGRFLKIASILWPYVGNVGSPVGAIKQYLKSDRVRELYRVCGLPFPGGDASGP